MELCFFSFSSLLVCCENGGAMWVLGCFCFAFRGDRVGGVSCPEMIHALIEGSVEVKVVSLCADFDSKETPLSSDSIALSQPFPACFTGKDGCACHSSFCSFKPPVHPLQIDLSLQPIS